MLERRRYPRSSAPGFTLPAVIIVAVAMLILAIGLLSIIGIERKTARSFADAKRAEMAARAGLEDFNALLRTETANDDYLVIASQSPNVPRGSLKEAPAQLFLARGEGGGNTVNYRYLPLFSSKELPQGNAVLKAPEIEEVKEEDEDFTPIKALPWQDAPRVAWIPVQDSKGETVARYAYWVEDLQGKLDPKTAGDADKLVRNEWPFPASGINAKPTDKDEFKLDQVAIRVLDPKAVEKDDNDLTGKIIEGRPMMLSPESVTAAAGFKAPLMRDSNGLLEDPVAAALERSTSAVIQPYEELATVPHAPGISADAAGKPKLNLNALLAKNRPAAVDEFAGWIKNGLPAFESRKGEGGFPDDYLRTLAANALDYADADNDPTIGSGYRGLDGYPLVSEFATTFRLNGVSREGGRIYLLFTVTSFPELWNMTDQPVSGMGQLSFETKFSFQAGFIPSISFETLSTNSDVASPVAVEEEGYKWQPPFQINLQPNEIKLFACRTQFKINVGAASDFIVDPITLSVSGGPVTADGECGYRFRWNGKMVDQSRGNIWRNGGDLNIGKNPRQFTRAVVPAHSLSTTPLQLGPFDNNMGDPRMSFYLKMRQASNAYPGNYSPNRRNIRWGSIYGADGPTKPKVYGRVLPSEWPDGGHDFAFGPRVNVTDPEINPDDPAFGVAAASAIDRKLSPMRLSNLGRFYSATELGRTYDPVMWKPTYAKPDGSAITADTKTLQDGNLPGNQPSWPEVTLPSSPTQSNGGGNTLRIGRAEHQRFKTAGAGLHAAHLLDLFHAGKGSSDDKDEREGKLVDMRGTVNLNTATADTIRALAAGLLKQDPKLSYAPSKNHQVTSLSAMPTSLLELGTPTNSKVADRIAEGILLSRPFGSAADIARSEDKAKKPVFGNREMYSQGTDIQWTDSAAEEVFARVYEASTLRSRNFRVWVIGQAVYTPPEGSDKPVEVLSETKKVFTVFADPGERKDDGSINPDTYRARVTHENDF